MFLCIGVDFSVLGSVCGGDKDANTVVCCSVLQCVAVCCCMLQCVCVSVVCRGDEGLGKVCRKRERERKRKRKRKREREREREIPAHLLIPLYRGFWSI